MDDILNENAYGDMIVSVKKTFNRSEHVDFHQLMEQQEKQIIEYALKKRGHHQKGGGSAGTSTDHFRQKEIETRVIRYEEPFTNLQ